MLAWRPSNTAAEVEFAYSINTPLQRGDSSTKSPPKPLQRFPEWSIEFMSSACAIENGEVSVARMTMNSTKYRVRLVLTHGPEKLRHVGSAWLRQMVILKYVSRNASR